MQKSILFSMVFCVASVVALPSEKTCSLKTNLFIVKPEEKKVSKHSPNALKELIGESFRDAFKHSIALGKELGQFHVAIAAKKEAGKLHQELGVWQIELAALQQHCSEVLEKLIENQKPFKKASKQELLDAHKNIQDAQERLRTLLVQVKAEQKNFTSGNNVQTQAEIDKIIVSVQSCATQTKNVCVGFNAHSCLKCA